MNGKHLRTAAASAAALSVVLTGCGSGDDTEDAASKGPVTVEWWSWEESKYNTVALAP